MIAYKLFRRHKNGSIGPLFINRRMRLEKGITYEAEDVPTKGFAHRPYWHSCASTDGAPHLKQDDTRVWCKVWIGIVSTVDRPASQGGEWFLSKYLRVLEVLE